MSEVRTRFAPAPTGYLHIGGARTALFNWLFTRHHGGEFILRVEDTDVARSTKEYITTILDSLQWLGLDWDEGPYFQSERMDLYREHVERLLLEGKAYRCYCTPEELERRRQQAFAEGRKPKYDGRCRNRVDQPTGLPSAVRFKSPQNGVTVVDDLIKGKVTFQNEELDDLIIQRSDGIPTYNFVVVVDDALMRITHVIRGDDHLNNTPRQILIYEGLGYPIPKFAHVPLIMGEDHTRLSKRHGATSVTAYQEMGYLPHALVNYLARLGWSYGDQEVFTKRELIDKFSLQRVGKSASIFNPEKLLWLNAHYIREGDPCEISQALTPFLRQKGEVDSDDQRFVKAVGTVQPRAKTLVEMAETIAFYLTDDFSYDEKGAREFLQPDIVPFLSSVVDKVKGMKRFDQAGLEPLLRDQAEQKAVKLKEAAQAVRMALTGGTVSPGLFEMMEILGKKEVIKRLQKAIRYIHSTAR